MDFLIGGAGGAYLLAEPGELTVDIVKRDRHVHDRNTDLRVVLAGPDRRVIHDETIPDDGGAVGSGMGDPGHIYLSTEVEHPGIYALNITISSDRYGEEIVWGFRTSCRKYVIETSRGHKDDRHEEPIEFCNPGKEIDVCWRPIGDAFDVEVMDYPPESGAPTVFDSEGNRVATLSIDAEGRGSQRFAADVGQRGGQLGARARERPDLTSSPRSVHRS